MEQVQLSIYFRLNEAIHENILENLESLLNQLRMYHVTFFCKEGLQVQSISRSNSNQIYYRDDQDYVEKVNKQILQSKESYVMFLEPTHFINEEGLKSLLTYANNHHSDFVYGYASYKPVRNGLLQKYPIFQFEKYKKFHINIGLFNEPTLLHTVSLVSTKIIRREFLLENNIEVTIDDVKSKFVRFQLNCVTNSNQITYIPKEVLVIEQADTDFDHMKSYLNECHQIRKELENETYRKQFEICVFSEVYRYVIDLCSNELIQKETIINHLNDLKKELEEYDFAFLNKLKQEYYTLFSLLQKGYINELMDYVTMFKKEMILQNDLKVASTKYNQYKRNSSKILMKFYQMYENVVNKK